ncbi:tRNA (adenosine(37)-N6)-threonylcarbamoyltransferase complex dimerization subunit type 1 TsaB [Bacillus solimangrovi]|uniref:tRNA (Adenosine(37)-N6)-threonylcarbamoyltransferase complex dimerization subunit type 1 TsaB n=1 Tax=Bacillus solimangrovi TaxID=1305675 RepID=A0A1E5LCB1_9BACI|nr:tRNA (adenosine(37)-N6)-threonylcarbamoyltransferase complex dimerization subunit type 1 TsaB [Bacillus solimangrovi]OEH91724.1 tRNA (adenosine(37)-N6)-threonylcarbamoyltransferase complex dimerization subunit type 1 TsaB [Bacillus solimangrovi]
MKVLAIDTSNDVMGVAIVDDNKVIGELITNVKKNHSVRLMPAIEKLLNETDVKVSELDRIVVAEGPGSYTGVRIGVTVAKTLAWSLNIELVGVSGLESLAYNGRYFNGLIVPIFDARRGQVFTGLYQWNDGMLESVMSDKMVIFSELLTELKERNEPVLFVGNDVDLHRELIVDILGDNAIIANFVQNNPRPSELAGCGLLKQPVDVHSFVPNYLRLAEAEANWLKAQKK